MRRKNASEKTRKASESRTKELNRLEKKLTEAENSGKLLVLAEAGDQNTPNSTNPYPIFFTAEQLVKEINNGSWHLAYWYLEDKEVMKKTILQCINKLQERLITL